LRKIEPGRNIEPQAWDAFIWSPIWPTRSWSACPVGFLPFLSATVVVLL